MNTTTDVKKWLDDEDKESIIEKMQRARWALTAVKDDKSIRKLEHDIILTAIEYITMMLKDRNNSNLLK